MLTFLINEAALLGENVICLIASSTGSPLICKEKNLDGGKIG